MYKLVEVTQEDREAAAMLRQHTVSIGANGRSPIAIRAGEWDEKETVQAFARHRLAATRTPDPTDAGVEALLALFTAKFGNGLKATPWRVNPADAREVIAAIRALLAPPAAIIEGEG